MEENKKKITEIQTNVYALDKEICLLENDKKPLNAKKGNVETSISDKKQKIEKLRKKIFGKRKAEEEVQLLNEEINKLNQELQTLSEQIKIADKPISNKKLEKSNFEKAIKRLEQENVELRNR